MNKKATKIGCLNEEFYKKTKKKQNTKKQNI
jgi:hypothetical protein